MRIVRGIRVILIMMFVLFRFSVGWSNAGEHPSEHPTKKAKVEKKAGISKGNLAKAIQGYIKEETNLKGGYFLVYDQKAKKPLALKLVRVHKKRLSRVGSDVYFACADFKAPEGKVYDLDIFMKGTDVKNLKVTEISVHKEAGKPRYTWYEKGGIWKKSFVGKEKKVKTKKKEHSSEHPSAEHPK